MKQTSVEWLVNNWKKLQAKGEKMTWQHVIDITELAKEMEKEQIIDAHIIGDNTYTVGGAYYDAAEQYYNETFNTKLK